MYFAKSEKRMANVILAHWKLDRLIREKIEAVAVGIAYIVRPAGQIIWDDECQDLGRTAWIVEFFGDLARKRLSALNAATAPLQAQFDLGITAD
jgi:hypothetical protein